MPDVLKLVSVSVLAIHGCLAFSGYCICYCLQKIPWRIFFMVSSYLQSKSVFGFSGLFKYHWQKLILYSVHAFLLITLETSKVLIYGQKLSASFFLYRYNELQDPTYQYKIDIGHFMVRRNKCIWWYPSPKL